MYHDLKKKLSYDTGGPQTSSIAYQSNAGGGDISAGIRPRKDNLLGGGLGGQVSSAKNMRQTSVNNPATNTTLGLASSAKGSSNLYLAN